MTDQELRDLVAQNTLSTAALQRTLAEMAAQSKKSDERLDRVIKKSEKIEKALAKFIKKSEKIEEELALFIKASKKSDERLDRVIEKSEKTDRKLNQLAKMYGDSENNKGRAVEEYFLRYFENNPFLAGIHFDTVDHAVFSRANQEHDIVLQNGNSIAAISVKYRVRVSSIEHLINQELPRLKPYFMDIKGITTFYLGVASFLFDKEAMSYADESGLFMFTQSGESTQSLNSANFVPKVW